RRARGVGPVLIVFQGQPLGDGLRIQFQPGCFLLGLLECVVALAPHELIGSIGITNMELCARFSGGTASCGFWMGFITPAFSWLFPANVDTGHRLNLGL